MKLFTFYRWEMETEIKIGLMPPMELLHYKESEPRCMDLPIGLLLIFKNSLFEMKQIKGNSKL